MSLLSGPTRSMTSQLSNQYAPGPPYAAGDPGEAPPELTAAVRAGQADFIAKIRLATEEVIGNG